MWLKNLERLEYCSVAYRSRVYRGGTGNYNSTAVDMSHSPVIQTTGTARDYIRPYPTYALSHTSTPVNAIVSQTATTWDYCNYQCNWVVGSGTTPVTEDDYCLESEITSLSAVAVTYKHTPSSGILQFEKTMKNTSSETICVSEIGIVVISHYDINITGTSTGSGTAFPVMVYREVLETPIEVPAGENFTVSITHQLPMPT